MTRPTRSRLLTLLLASALPLTPLQADSPEILNATISKVGMDWRVDVTVQHPDTGWDHYADGWEVLDADGNRLGYRELLHPHVNEQPFTRSLHNIDLPDGTREVFVKAHCNKDGWDSALYQIKLDP